MSTTRLTSFLLLATAGLGWLALPPQPPAAAQVEPLAESMAALSTEMEDALHWLLRDDFVQLEHVGIELVRAVERNITIAQVEGLAPEMIEQLVEMREEAEELQEEAGKRRLKKASRAYVKLLEGCMECHVDARE